ncbi:MAG: recombination protein O N-terminal domain-containing protein [Patescibacteria group bacterium]
MEETYTTKAIVLNRQPFRENDSRVVVYSFEQGKMELVARGTKKKFIKAGWFS